MDVLYSLMILDQHFYDVYVVHSKDYKHMGGRSSGTSDEQHAVLLLVGLFLSTTSDKTSVRSKKSCTYCIDQSDPHTLLLREAQQHPKAVNIEGKNT